MRELFKRRAKVRLARIPQEKGINGPDDYIGSYGPESFFQSSRLCKRTHRNCRGMA
jgi:hypothetical protein